MNSFNYPHYPDLKNKAILITGGGSGIGASFVEAFALQGSKVAFLDIQEQVSKKLVKTGLNLAKKQISIVSPQNLSKPKKRTKQKSTIYNLN